MKTYLALRHPVTASLMVLLLLVLIGNTLGCPAFQQPGPEKASAGLDQEPLVATSLPKRLRKALPRTAWHSMSDSRGSAYGASNPLSGPAWRSSSLAADLERALEHIAEGSFPFALKLLERNYNGYPAKVLGTRSNDTDEMPSTRKELLGYGLVRYNRAVVLMAMADALDPRDQKRIQFLRRACYDLRRTVGAFERLGSLNEFGSEPYWGRDIMAWDGYGLEPDDSGLPIHQVYANLAIAYFRLGDQDGYPEVELRYMAREERKYTTGQSPLSAIVSLLIQNCLKGEAPSNRKYRLTMALQNLEAAGRGMTSDGGVRFNYTIGLILAELYRLDEGVEPQHALGFLELAARGDSSGSAKNAVLAARRELALIYLGLERDDRFLEILKELTPGALLGTSPGMQGRGGLSFADVALYSHLRKGDWEIAANHLTYRMEELAGQLASEATLADYRAMVDTVCDTSMQALKRRLRQQWQNGEGHLVTGYVLGMKANPNLNGNTPLGEAFDQHIWGGLRLYPGIRISLWLTRHPGFRWLLIATPYVLMLLLAGYASWFYRSHRQQAAQRLQSGYVQDVHGA